MKFLKYLLFLLLAIVVIFLALGMFTPSITYDSEVVIDKPAAEVWAVMNDESKMSNWLPGYVKSELVSGTRNTVGAVSKVYFNEAGQETVMTETITAITPNERLAMDFSIPDFMDMAYELVAKEEGGKTTMTSSTTTTGNGMMSKSIVAIMKGAMSDQEDTNMMALKKLAEENTTDYFPETKIQGVLEIQE